jgi:peptidyl-prolyl cis-trans isomerase B (cyclophilin B)
MSLRNQQPQNRRSRRQNPRGASDVNISEMDLPGPLKVLGNRKLFFAVALVAGIAMVGGLLVQAIGGPTTTNTDGPQQANEAPDIPVTPTLGPDQTPEATPVATAEVKRYTAPPAMTIDASKTYSATVKTSKGDITMELYPSQAPEAVNAFVFLASEGYYNGTPFMELVKAPDGGKFYAQAGDPTATGFGTPGFSVKKERTDLGFDRGAVGMGGTAENSNGGQFFISFRDFPALDGKYTIFGKVVGGLEVLDSLSLLDITDRSASSTGDKIESISISES